MISECEVRFLEPGQRRATLLDDHWGYGVITGMDRSHYNTWRDFKIYVAWDFDQSRIQMCVRASNAYIKTVCQNCGRVSDDHV